MRGDSLPTRILVGWGHVWLRVEPFVEAVKQCFKCLRFGHIQAGCKSTIRKCFVCTKEAHGKCEDKPKCNNCGGEHLSVARECQIYQREAAIKKIMAYKNVSYNTAHEIIRKEEKINKYGERYVGEEEESEDEERGDKDFPALRRNWKKIEYWENLPIPTEKERGRWNRTWGRNKEQTTYRREEERYGEDQSITRERRMEHYRGRYGNDGDKEIMTRQNKETTNEEIQQKDYITEQIRSYQQEDRRRDNNKGGYQEKYRKKEEDRIGRQNNLSGRYKTERKDGWTQQQEKRINNKESTKYIQMEGRERRKGDETRREGEITNNNEDNMGIFKNKGEDNIIEEIVKIIKDKNILAKVMKKLIDDQRESKKEETRELIEEDDWNTPCTRTTENTQRNTGKTKIKLINKCFTEERETNSEEEENKEDLRKEKKREKEKKKQEGIKEREKHETKMGEIKIEELKELLIQKKEIENKEKEDNLDGKSISETEDWKSVTTENDNESLGTVEWLEEKEIEQEERMSETGKGNKIREREKNF